MEKICVVCGVGFEGHGATKYCRTCVIIVVNNRSKEHKKNNREHYLNMSRTWAKNNRERTNEINRNCYRKKHPTSNPESHEYRPRQTKDERKCRDAEIVKLWKTFESSKNVDITSKKILAIEQAFKRMILTPEIIKQINKGDTYYAYSKRD